MKTIIGMATINLKQSKKSYLITGIVFALGAVNYILSLVIPGSEGNGTVSAGNYLYLLPLLMAIFIPAQNYTKLMNLGGKRRDFFKSAILSYAPAVAAVTLVSMILHYTVDAFMLTKIADIYDLLAVFGFLTNGNVLAFFQMCAFLLMFCCVTHTLTLIQGRWYGWVADVLIIAIISVFTPVAPLRAVLVWFFNMIIFHDIAIVQIISCLILGAAVYYAGLIPIKSKQI